MTPHDGDRRVLHAVSHYGKISEGFVADAVTSVEAEGWQSWVLCREVEHREVFPAPPDERIRLWRRPTGLLSGEVPRRWLPGVAERAAERGVAPYVRDVAPEVVHAHFGWNAPDVVRSTWGSGIPLVATFHASDLTIYPTLTGRQRMLPSGWFRDHRYSGVFPRMQAGIVVSEYIGDRLRELGFEARIHVIPAGIDLKSFPFRPPSVDGDVLRLIFVGRLVPRKGLDVLLRALADPAAPAAELRVIGDGPERAQLEQLARALGVAERVRFLGAQPRDQVLRTMAEHDVLVMSSRRMATGEVEGSPVVTKEAQAIGLPVVVTDNGGTRETLPPAHRQDVVPEEDPRALALALARTAVDRANWPARVGLARAFVEEHFDWAHLGRRTASVYDELVASRLR